MFYQQKAGPTSDLTCAGAGVVNENTGTSQPALISTSDPGSYNCSMPEMTCHPEGERERETGRVGGGGGHGRSLTQ